MTWKRTVRVIAVLFLSRVTFAADPVGSLAVWPVDPHTKVFRDITPPEGVGSIAMRAARNEYEAGQLAIRSSRPLKEVRLELSPLRHSDGVPSIVKAERDGKRKTALRSFPVRR